ncbi:MULTISPECIES: lipopolysaccharide biosynthesis protein [Halocynthiibacter]|uniref:lipopolysaccharide biosynthesis protein n=1 Tax=Halocynthiibacter TaxID=1579315 RepID=UPI0021F17B6C|nr:MULTISPECIES: hypothetical protein [Halocynthiibacter]
MKESNTSARKLISDSISTILLKAGSLLVSLAFVSVLSFALPASEYGKLAVVLSAAMICSAIGSFGQYDLLVRDLSKSSPDREGFKKQIAVSTNWAFWGGIACGSAASMLLLFGGFGYRLAIAVLALSSLLSISFAWSGAARARGENFWSLAPREILWRLAVVIITGGLLVIDVQISAASMGLLLVAVLLLFLLLQGQKLGFRLRWITLAKPARLRTQRAKCSFDLMIGQVAAVGLSTVDIVIVGLMISETAAAEYFPANRIALAVSTVTFALYLVISPLVSATHSKFDREKLEFWASIATAASVSISILIGALIWVGYPLVSMLFATATSPTATALTILILAQVLQASLGFGNAFLAMTGRERALRKIEFWGLVFGLMFMAIAALSGSIVLVAGARLIAVVAKKAVVAYTAYKLTGFAPFSLKAPTKALRHA